MSIELSTQLQPAPSLPVAPTTTWRQRLVSRLQPHIDAFRQGSGCAIVLDGALNAFFGLFADLSQKGASTEASLALLTGVVQICGGARLAYRAGEEIVTVGSFASGVTGAGTSLYLLQKLFPNLEKLSRAARISIGVSVQTGSSFFIGGAASVITTALAKKAVDLYYDYRVRRAHPEASSPLITSDDSDLEQPEPTPPTTG